GDFELVPKEVMRKYLQSLGAAVLQHCPESDRAVLERNMALLGQSSAGDVDASPVDVVHMGGGAGGAPKPAAAAAAAKAGGDAPVSEEAARGLKRLSVFLD